MLRSHVYLAFLFIFFPKAPVSFKLQLLGSCSEAVKEALRQLATVLPAVLRLSALFIYWNWTLGLAARVVACSSGWLSCIPETFCSTLFCNWELRKQLVILLSNERAIRKNPEQTKKATPYPPPKEPSNTQPVTNTQSISFSSTLVDSNTELTIKWYYGIFKKVSRKMYDVCSHKIVTASFVCDTVYYWWYWTKGGAVLRLVEF